MFEDFASLFFGDGGFVRDSGDELGFGERFSHIGRFFRWLLFYGLVQKSCDLARIKEFREIHASKKLKKITVFVCFGLDAQLGGLDFMGQFPNIRAWRSSPSRTIFVTKSPAKFSKAAWALSMKASSMARAVS